MCVCVCVCLFVCTVCLSVSCLCVCVCAAVHAWELMEPSDYHVYLTISCYIRGRYFQVNRAKLGRYEKSLEQLRHDNQNLSGQVSRLDQEKSDMQFQLHAKTKEPSWSSLKYSGGAGNIWKPSGIITNSTI